MVRIECVFLLKHYTFDQKKHHICVLLIMLCSLKGQLESMRREMVELTARLESMTNTQKKVHKENVDLRRSFKQKESELERSLQETISRSSHDELRAECDALQEELTAEQGVSAEKSAEIEKLRKKNSSLKQELLQTQRKSDTIQAELDGVNRNLETSSQHIHSLQRELQEKEMANKSTHQTLQKFIKEQQETLEENEELKRELSAREQNQKAAKETHDRLRKQSTSLEHHQQQKEKEIAEVTRQLRESKETVTGLQMDKESLADQLKRIQEDIGGYQVRIREMEQSVTRREEELSAERQSHTKRVGRTYFEPQVFHMTFRVRSQLLSACSGTRIRRKCFFSRH